MEERTRHRAVGAGVLLLVAAIVLPLVLESSPPGERISPDPAPADPPVSPPDRIRITPFAGVGGERASPGSGGRTESPAAPADPAAVPRSDPSAGSPTGDWAVQIGSFANPGNAEKLREQVASRGYRVLTQRVTSGEGKSRVRVLVGPDRTRAAAAARRSRLQREESIEGFLVRYPG